MYDDVIFFFQFFSKRCQIDLSDENSLKIAVETNVLKYFFFVNSIACYGTFSVDNFDKTQSF